MANDITGGPTMRNGCARGVVAITAALVLLVMFQSPASAAGHTADITGGDIVLTKAGLNTTTLSLASAGCPAGNLALDIDETVTPVTVDVTAFSAQARLIHSLIADLVVVITRHASTAGTIAPTGPMVGLGITLNYAIYTRATGTTCGVGAKLCDLRSTMTTAGAYTALPVSVGDTAVLSAPSATLIPVSTCGVPASNWMGAQATLNLLTFTITS